jgi:hypothetical protein
MIHLIKTISLFSLCLLSFSFVNNGQSKLKTGFYYLAEKENEGELIGDIDSEDKFAVDKNEVLTVSDFSEAKFATRNFKPNPIRVIELKLTKEGRKKWAAIKKRITKSGESIVFICNDKIYLEKRIAGKTSLGNSTIDLFIDSKYQDIVLQAIQSELTDNR